MPTTITSARLPGSSEPICASIPSARAPPMRRHLERGRARSRPADRPSAACAGTTPAASPRTCRGRCCWPRRRCRGRAATPPRGTPGPAPCRSRASCCSRGCATRRRRARCRIAISASDTQTPCAARTPGPQKSERSRYADRSRVEAFLRHLHLVARLGEVDEHRHAVLARTARARPSASARRACTSRAAPPPARSAGRP